MPQRGGGHAASCLLLVRRQQTENSLTSSVREGLAGPSERRLSRSIISPGRSIARPPVLSDQRLDYAEKTSV